MPEIEEKAETDTPDDNFLSDFNTALINVPCKAHTPRIKFKSKKSGSKKKMDKIANLLFEKAAEKQKTKGKRRSTRLDAQMSVVENLQKKLDVGQAMIQVSIADWLKQSSLVASLQAELRRYKEECKIKSKMIAELQELNSTLRVTIEQKLDTVIQQGRGVKIDAGADVCSASTSVDPNFGLNTSGDQVELATGVFVDQIRLEAIRYNRKLKPSKIVRNLVTLIFSRDEILNQSVTGKECNFNKKVNRKEATEPLDERKVHALTEEFRRILRLHKYSADNIDKEVQNVAKYIKSKLSTEKQAEKKKQRACETEESGATNHVSSNSADEEDSAENYGQTSDQNITCSDSEAPEILRLETECSAFVTVPADSDEEETSSEETCGSFIGFKRTEIPLEEETFVHKKKRKLLTSLT